MNKCFAILIFLFYGVLPSLGQGKVNRNTNSTTVTKPKVESTNQYKSPKHLSLATVNNSGVRQYFTIDEWESFSKSKQDQYRKIGVCVITNGHSFIVAGKDADKGELSWRNYQDGIVSGLKCYSTKEAAIQDFDGKSNSAKLNSVNSPSAAAACMYRAFPGDKTDWYLPACGQLWLMSQNAFAINKAFNIFGLEKFRSTPAYNSSTQYGVYKSYDGSWSTGWGVNLSSASVYKYGGFNNDYVRSVADL